MIMMAWMDGKIGALAWKAKDTHMIPWGLVLNMEPVDVINLVTER